MWNAELLPDHRSRLPQLIPLSYSIPGFTRDGWRNADEWLRQLHVAGFSWVTLHPTFAVTDSVPPRIDVSNIPPVAEAVASARSLGLCIRLEPHLDWTHSLDGSGAYEWRRRMFIDPMDEYFERVLLPLAELKPDELTLGSELDVSAYEFGSRWRQAAANLRNSGVAALGHKLNHDWQAARRAIRREASVERERHGLSPHGWPGFGYGAELEEYLGDLDYVAVSFYPPEGRFELDPRYTVGEFGLGSPDVSRPWHFDKTAFRTPEDFQIRRGYYLRILDWLSRREGQGRAASFWTVEQFDVLGLMWPEWRDEAIATAVRDYLANCC